MAKRKLSARQIRWLFATGKLRASGKGKDRKVTYSKEGQAPKRAAIGGSKAAGLRSGSGKRDFSATRAQRISAGRERLTDFATQAGRSGDKGQYARISKALNAKGGSRAGNVITNLRSGRHSVVRAQYQVGQAALSKSPAAQKLVAAREKVQSSGLPGTERHTKALRSVEIARASLRKENRARRKKTS